MTLWLTILPAENHDVFEWHPLKTRKALVIFHDSGWYFDTGGPRYHGFAIRGFEYSHPILEEPNPLPM